jgi:hypothetical protein
MAPQNVRLFEGRKFMWDGEVHASRDAADAKRKEYEGRNFEAQSVEEDGTYLVYTRRVVTGVVVEGEPPPA